MSMRGGGPQGQRRTIFTGRAGPPSPSLAMVMAREEAAAGALAANGDPPYFNNNIAYSLQIILCTSVPIARFVTTHISIFSVLAFTHHLLQHLCRHCRCDYMTRQPGCSVSPASRKPAVARVSTDACDAGRAGTPGSASPAAPWSGKRSDGAVSWLDCLRTSSGHALIEIKLHDTVLVEQITLRFTYYTYYR